MMQYLVCRWFSFFKATVLVLLAMVQIFMYEMYVFMVS